MNTEYSVRMADISDSDTIVGFTVEEARETEGEDPDHRAVTRGVQAGLEGSAPSTYWVAQSSNGEVLGSISVVTEWSNFRGGYYWWVQSLYIVPEHRGSGLVDLLLDCVSEAARAAHALDLRLLVLQSNHRAKAAYRRCGFDIAPYTTMVRRLGKP